MSWMWHGRTMETYGDIISVVSKIVDSGDRAFAQEFRQAYIEGSELSPEQVDSNIGFTMGEFDREKMARGLLLFDVKHPIFGGGIEAAATTPEEAFALGQKWAREKEQA